jgi:hypothetical protein
MKIIYLLKTYKKLILGTGCLVSALILINFNVFYQTGYGYAEFCWQVQNSKNLDKPTDFKEVMQQAKFAMKAKQCEVLPQKALYGRGYVVAGNPEYAVTPELQLIQKSCPNGFNELPWGGIEYWVISEAVNNNKLNFLDKFIPANITIQRLIDNKWGDCPTAREKAGIPKLVEKNAGAWEFESECIPCKAEREAAEIIKKSSSLLDYLKKN